MKSIDEQQFQHSWLFLNTHARMLDRRLAEYYFWGGRIKDVREALKSFLNPDGGFGNSIEPDFRLQQSSPMATTIGLQYAREINLPSDDPIVQAAVRYLLTAFDPDQQRWHAVPAQINNVPHAPWWTLDVNTGRCGVEETWANPNAEIVGYLWQYRDLVPQPFLTSVTDVALAELVSVKL